MKSKFFKLFLLVWAYLMVKIVKVHSTFCEDYYTQRQMEWRQYKSHCQDETGTRSRCCAAVGDSMVERWQNVRILCPHYGAKLSILFHRRNISDYVISEGAPDMTAVTACFWVKTNQTKGLAHYISYAVPENDNEFLIEDQRCLMVSIRWPNSRRIRSGGKINDGKWHPICFTWSSQYGQYKFFKDGKIVDHGVGFSIGKTIIGGGTWVLGQDQDVQGGSFDVDQMVQGEMTDVNIWNKVLTEREILEISATCLSQHKGNVKSWNDFTVGVRGDVKKLQKPTCA